MREERTIKINQLDIRATIQDGELEYLKVMAKKATLNKEETMELLDWLIVVLEPNLYSNKEIKNIKKDVDEKVNVYNGGAIPLDQRSANNPPEANLASQVVDMSDKLIEKPIVKFSTPK